QGVSRAQIGDMAQVDPFLKAFVTPLADEVEDGVETEGLLRNVQALFQKVLQLAPNLQQEVAVAFANITEPGRVADFVAANLNLSTAERQELLETANATARLRKVLPLLPRAAESPGVRSRTHAQK